MMMKTFGLLLVLLLVTAGLAQAAESCANVANTSTSVLTSANNLGSNLICQNLGGTNDVNCSIGGTPVSGQQGFLLKAGGGSLTLPVYPVTTAGGSGQVRIPGGAVSCITGSSTSYACCLSW